MSGVKNTSSRSVLSENQEIRWTSRQLRVLDWVEEAERVLLRMEVVPDALDLEAAAMKFAL